MSNITLFIPGLLTPARDSTANDFPEIPALKFLLSHGQSVNNKTSGISETLWNLFGVQREPDRDLPVAAVTHLIDENQMHEGVWMRADPVHLSSDVSKMILMDDNSFNLDQHDALILAADIRQLFTDRGLNLYAPTIHRWYVEIAQRPEIMTTPVHEVTGKDISAFLPRGPDQLFWNKLLNEIQITLHNSPVNNARGERSELLINSVWFWGSGSLPKSINTPYNKVYTDDIISRGLAVLSGKNSYELPEDVSDILMVTTAEDNILVVVVFGYYHTQYMNHHGWLDFINYLETQWFSPLLREIRQGRINSLRVIDEHKQVTINRLSLLKFWKGKFDINLHLN